MRIKFLLNGRHYCTYLELTLQEILTYFNFQNKIFIVEYNNIICDSMNWKFTKISNNDKIEIISIVGGG